MKNAYDNLQPVLQNWCFSPGIPHVWQISHHKMFQQGSRETRKDAKECKSPARLFAYQIACSTLDQIRWKLYHLTRGSTVIGIKKQDLISDLQINSIYLFMPNIRYTDLRWTLSKRRISLISYWWTSLIKQPHGFFYNSQRNHKESQQQFQLLSENFILVSLVNLLINQITSATIHPLVNSTECLTCLEYPNSQQCWKTRAIKNPIQNGKVSGRQLKE